MDRAGDAVSEFDYLIDKIVNAEFDLSPFKHVTILNFFSQAHFNEIIRSNQIKLPLFESNRDLIDHLEEIGYRIQHFPGCITDKVAYLKYLESPSTHFKRSLIKGYGKELMEGYGVTYRLGNFNSPILERLVHFLNTADFKQALVEKFSVDKPTTVETAIQKNLTGYQISPHPDIRRKALTYMVNIYTDGRESSISMHTHLSQFKDQYRYIYDFWRHNQDIDTCWVPWDWCDTIKETNINNSITIFKPNYDTLHAVKLDYDHLAFQRNQIYGNLWYEQSANESKGDLRYLDMRKLHREKPRISYFFSKWR